MDRQVHKIFFLVFLFLSFSTYAFGLGVENPYNWYGTGARLNADGNTIAEDINTTPGGTAGDSHLDTGDVNGDAHYQTTQDISLYEFHGFLKTEGYGYNYSSGGFFRDEFYIETYNGESADIAISFDVSLTMETFSNDSYASFLLTGGFYDNGTYQQAMGGTYSVSLENVTDFLSVDHKTVTLYNMYNFPGFCIESGKYYGFSIGAWGYSKNSVVDWSNSIYFSDIVVSQDDVPLTEDQYTFRLASNSVPVPTTILLLGSGLFGLAGLRKRLKKA